MAVKEFVQKLKETVDIVDVVGEQVALKRTGSRYKGLSPFSQEKTPSFFVNPETGTYHCFSTNNGGDVIDFVMETKGMSFIEAVRWLADRAGMDVPKGSLGKVSTPAEKEEKEALKVALKVNKFAALFYQNQLRGAQGAKAREYAESRGLDEKTQKNFAIGYAPDGWNSLRDYLVSIQAPIAVAVQLGLLKAKNDETPRADGANLYDIFRNRLIFPIRDGNGEVVGFGGRTLDSGDKVKYLNSPESAVFAKGQMFFNYDRARKHIRDTETAIIVEGYMDCIALDQAGFGNVVATLGTALTPAHVQILRKMAARVVNLYDSDSAGQAASLRNMDLFLKEAGFPISGIVLPEGKDPDDFLKARPDTGAKELQALIHEAPSMIDTWVDGVIAEAPKTVQGRADCLKIIAEKLALLSDPIWFKARIPGISDRLMLDAKLVLEAILHARRERGAERNSAPNSANAPAVRKSPEHPQKAENNARKSATTGAGFEAQFLRYLLLYPERLRELRGLHQANDQVILPLIENETVGKIVGFLLRPLDEQNGETDARRLSGLVEALDLRQESAQKNFISKAMAESAGELAPAAPLAQWLRKLRIEVQEKRTQDLKARIKQAEASGDLARIEELQRELHTAIQSFRTNSMETTNG